MAGFPKPVPPVVCRVIAGFIYGMMQNIPVAGGQHHFKCCYPAACPEKGGKIAGTRLEPIIPNKLF